MFVFKKRSCILHHFAFLFGAELVVFSPPKTCIQPLKCHILMGVLPFSAMFLMVLTGMFIPIMVNYYAFYLAFSSILHCIQQHFALHLAPFYLAFSIKTHCIQHQNALRFAPYCTAFCTETHFILLKMAQKRVLVAVSLNKNSFCLHAQLPPFCTQTNLRENRFFAARLAIG